MTRERGLEENVHEIRRRERKAGWERVIGELSSHKGKWVEDIVSQKGEGGWWGWGRSEGVRGMPPRKSQEHAWPQELKRGAGEASKGGKIKREKEGAKNSIFLSARAHTEQTHSKK